MPSLGTIVRRALPRSGYTLHQNGRIPKPIPHSGVQKPLHGIRTRGTDFVGLAPRSLKALTLSASRRMSVIAGHSPNFKAGSPTHDLRLKVTFSAIARLFLFVRRGAHRAYSARVREPGNTSGGWSSLVLDRYIREGSRAEPGCLNQRTTLDRSGLAGSR